jgi:hypothetical protein
MDNRRISRLPVRWMLVFDYRYEVAMERVGTGFGGIHDKWDALAFGLGIFR